MRHSALPISSPLTNLEGLMRPAITLFLGLLLGTSALQAQAHGVSKRPFTQEQFATACERGDPATLLNVSCEQIRGWLNVHRPGLEIAEGKLADYIRQLSVINCPTGQEFGLNRTMKGRILYERKGGGWKRPFRPGEQCLYDNNRAEVQFSLSCANSPYEVIPVGTAMVEVNRDAERSAIQVPVLENRDTTVVKVLHEVKQVGPVVVEHVFKQAQPPAQFELDYEVPKKGGFWCLRGAGQGATCTAGVLAIAVGTYLAFQKKESHDPGLPTVIALPPGPGAAITAALRALGALVGR